MALRLIVRDEQEGEAIHEFRGAVVSIGRSAENHLPITDRNSSRHHCEIHRSSEGFELHDRDSRNGTFVNGRRTQRCRLQLSDKIEIGSTVIYFQQRPGESPGLETVDITTSEHRAVPRDHSDDTVLFTDGDLPGRVLELAQGRERQILTQLIGLSRSLNRPIKLRELLEHALDAAIALSGAERGFLLLCGGDQRASVSVSRNLDGESVRDAKDKISRSVVQEVLGSGESVLLSDAVRSQDSRFEGKESIAKLKLHAILSAPLRHEDRILGAVYLDNRFKPDCFDEGSLELVSIVADHVALALENARLREENLRQKSELENAQEELLRLNELLRLRLEKQGEDLAAARAALASQRERVELVYDYSNIITCSGEMFDILTILDKVTDSNVPVLIQGESGTGKELIARALHFNGPRVKHSFVSENCAAIPQNLMESEFFGYMKGAFTGATRDKPGLFELADQGTLFLDEIGDMDMEIQTKLLRVLQEGVLRRIGAKDFRKVNVRILSATNKDLIGLIKEGKFREDLYYRLNVINLKLPPLRERREDIPLLVEHVLKHWAEERDAPLPSMEEKALGMLLRYDWPGNVRELQNELERALALTEGAIGSADLSPKIVGAAIRQQSRRLRPARPSPSKALDLKQLVAREVETIEAEVIAEILRETGYKKAQSAKLLGISRPTLDAKIDKYGLSKDRILTDSS